MSALDNIATGVHDIDAQDAVSWPGINGSHADLVVALPIQHEAERLP